MAREIADSIQTEFHPMVGLRNKGNYVKGKVTKHDTTRNGNPVVTLELIDLEGSTTKSVSKGVYEEVEVAQGDLVQVIGSVKQLREKLPQVQVGETVTIRFTEKIPLQGGKSLNKFSVIVEE